MRQKWWFVCDLGDNNEIKILRRLDTSEEAITWMRENDNGTYFVLEAVA